MTMMNETYLKPEERAIYRLRSLYRGYGYLPFKMSKFEEYEFYMRNKDFLVSDRIITFNDTRGRLMALKPDVTLSIIKNGEDAAGCKQRVYYNENVYRVSGSTHDFKEIMQTGIECIGDIDAYDICEVVTLAATSLDLVSPRFSLDISHLGLLSTLLDDINPDKGFRAEVTRCIGEKNAHDLERICREAGVSPEDTALLTNFLSIHGDMDTVLERLHSLERRHPATAIAIGELSALRDHLAGTPYAGRIRFDFSIVNDMNYYNGIVFCGYLDGICEGVLSGGQYNKLMRRMGRRAGAIGFALYLDLLEGMEESTPNYDVDVLLLYTAGTDTAAVTRKAAALRAEGKSVTVQRAVPDRVRYREICDMREEATR